MKGEGSPRSWRERYPNVITQLWNLSGADPSLHIANLAKENPHLRDADILELAFKQLL